MFACSATLAAPAAEARELRVADSFPVGHYLVRLLLKPWMDDVTKRTNGSITFAYFPAQQLGKASDLLRMTQAGLIDAMSTTAWDTSAILSDSSLFGRVLHTLVGYSDQPSVLQVVVYVVTLAAILTLSKLFGSARPGTLPRCLPARNGWIPPTLPGSTQSSWTVWTRRIWTTTPTRGRRFTSARRGWRCSTCHDSAIWRRIW